MPLNKLDNFIKNTEGRILYVNPSDLDSTDSITNEGNSLAQPFKTVQRALIEAARFSYLRGSDNDITEKTTILLFPGEHVIDNRPGFAIYNDNGVAKAVPPSGGVGTSAVTTLNLELDSNFDLTQEDNILYKFNSIHGGVIVPRGTSIVGLDLRKTKLRPKYVPNPTATYENTPGSAIFRITGACYFWQFSIFDGQDDSEVYTNPRIFTEEFRSTPRFSHHKLTCFEFCDGVNPINRSAYGELTDLDMYYHKVGNAYNSYREIENSSKFPNSSTSFSKKAPEWEIVGAFRADPITITNVISGNGTTPSTRITVTTAFPHELNSGTPIRIRGVGRTVGNNQLTTDSSTYNVSTFVQDIISDTKFTYLLERIPINLSASPALDNASATVETDTVAGASPYIFNISLRSVWGLNGMHADGSKCSGFKSMVVAQFTAVSLQKDDRAFAKYNKQTRVYDALQYTEVHGASLPAGASSPSSSKVYHLDQDAIYRPNWETSHIKVSNDSFIQAVSVFAIGFTYHFDMNSGADASITNSNSNFGQISLKSDGFKSTSFDKDDHGYVTGIIGPRSIDTSLEDEIEWLSLDVVKTRTVGDSNKLYLYGFTSESAVPVSLTQGFRIGAKTNDLLFLRHAGIEYSAPIYMMGKDSISNQQDRHSKEYSVTNINYDNHFFIGTNNLSTGERVIINSKKGDLPENLVEHQVYFAITQSTDTYNSFSNPDGLRSSEFIKLAASYTYAFLGEGVPSYGGSIDGDLIIKSRVSDKNAGDVGSPLVWDETNSQWYINVGDNNQIYNSFLDSGIGYDPTDDAKYSESTDLAYVSRVADERALDEKTYKLRVVIPKESENAKNPEIGFIMQDSKSTNPLTDNDIPFNIGSRTELALSNTKYNRNSRFIKTAEKIASQFQYTSESPHGLSIGDIIVVRKIKDSNEATTGQFNIGFNGSFIVESIFDEYVFSVNQTDIAGVTHNPGVIQNFTRTASELPVFERNNIQSNLYIYRNDVISDYVKDEKDGIYHLYILNASNGLPGIFSNNKFTQTPVDLYPQFDRDNYNSNPPSAKTFAKRSPIGDVATNDLKKSITKETVDIFCKDFNIGLEISSISNPTSNTPTLNFNLPHGLGSAVGGTLTEGSGHNNGVYYNVKLYTSTSQSEEFWKGATGRVTVSGGGVTNPVTEILIQEGGSGHNSGDKLYPDINIIGGATDAYLTLSTVGITTYIGDVLQIIGDGEIPDSYHRITSVGEKSIGIARTIGDSSLVGNDNRYAFIVGPSIQINNSVFGVSQTIVDGETAVTVGIVTFTTNESHGLSVGSQFRVIDSSNNNVGDYIVQDVASPTQINVRSKENVPVSVSNGYILKHGLSSNEGISDIRTESYAARGIPFYDGDYFKLTSDYSAGNTSSISFTCLSGEFIDKRLNLGDFIQINDEIFRISGEVNSAGNNASGTAIVSRGYLGTRQGNHKTGDLFKKIKNVPVEFRRPSICRASAHTFEYLGYGPGNYSTALPQVQIKTLSEREDFLVQAQERSGGAVVYTGMNSSGDTYNGNTKVSAASGETISYDIPKPTITGQDPSKLSVAFDEVTVRERIIVEGGTSGFVLSQFDGPVTMTRQLRVKGKATLNGQLRVTFVSSAINENTGSAVFKGGIGVGGDSYLKGKLVVTGQVQLNTGIIPQFDFKDSNGNGGSYIGTSDKPFSKAFIGDFRIGDTNTNTIDTRDGASGLDLSTAHGDLTLTSSGSNNSVTVTAGKNITATAATNATLTTTSGAITATAATNATLTTTSGNITATAGGAVTVTANDGDITLNPGSGDEANINETTKILGDLEVRGQGSNVPPGDRSGTIRANYLEIPNITPIGSAVLWAGKSNNLPTGTVNGSIVTMWKICNGVALNTYTYRALHAVISNTYGGTAYQAGATDQPTAQTTFNLPDLRNKFIIASAGDTGTNITGSTTRSGGNKDIELIIHNHDIDNVIDHNHTVQVDNDNANHNHEHMHNNTLTVQVAPKAAVTAAFSAGTSQNGSHRHEYDAPHTNHAPKQPGGGVECNEGSQGDDTDSAGTHAHQVQGSVTVPAHDHTVTSGLQIHNQQISANATHAHTASSGQNGGHNHGGETGQTGTEPDGINTNLPPYFALYYIMRVI